MRYVYFALQQDMLRLSCNSSGISSIDRLRSSGQVDESGTAVVAFAWSGLFVACLCS